MWGVEFTDEFETWWEGLPHDQQELLDQRVQPLPSTAPASVAPPSTR